MFVGIGVGVHRQRFAGSFATSYSSRVIADGGTIESLQCVAAASSLLQSASLLLIPSGYKAGVAYAELPANGNGDLTWSRNSVANRTQSNGNIGSVAANVPRLSYMYGSCPALLLEPQRTNSIRNSTMQGASTSPSTLPTNWLTATRGFTISVVGVGTENGLPYIDVRLNGTATGNPNIAFDASNQIVASNGQTWSNSVWIKVISTPVAPNAYRLVTGESTSSGAYVSDTYIVISPTSTLTRFTYTNTLSAGATVARVQPLLSFGVTIGNTYDFTVRIAAPQMELGAFATTWINTTNAAATRLVDSFSRNNIYTNGLISASGGTWYVELRNNVAYTRDASGTLGLFTSTVSTTYGFVIKTGTGTLQRLLIAKRVANVETPLYATLTDTIKVAIKWNGATADIFVNGTKQISATAFTDTVMEGILAQTLDVPKFIQAMALWPTPLSDTDCQTLTT